MWTKVAVALAIGTYVILVLTGVVAEDKKLGPAEYALIVFSILFIANFFDRLADISFGKEGFRFQLNQVKGRQDDTEALLVAIQVVLKGLVTKYEYQHLVDLNTPGPCMKKFGHIFFDEIVRLDSINFVRPVTKRGFNAIKEDHEHDPGEFDLKEYVDITDEGRAYVAIRKGAETTKQG
jgi:hypothetical protein